MTVLFVGKREREPWGEWEYAFAFCSTEVVGSQGEAVEAKCEGCERSRVARWSWQGGGEGLPGVSSQDGALSTPLRTGRSDPRRETVWRFIDTTADTNQAIALDKRRTMA